MVNRRSLAVRVTLKSLFFVGGLAHKDFLTLRLRVMWGRGYGGVEKRAVRQGWIQNKGLMARGNMGGRRLLRENSKCG